MTKKSPPVGLIASGNLTDSPLTRFWWLRGRLGPVKSPAYQVASRIAHDILRAGHPVKNYAALDGCRLILICVPDQLLPAITAELLSAPIRWRAKALVLCNTALDSGELDEFSARGAAVGSIGPIPGFDDARYLVEGDWLAVREAKSIVEHGERRAIAIQRALKPLYLAALTCTGSLLFALALAAFESLRHAGIPPLMSAQILDGQFTKTLRAYIKGGRRAYPAPQQLSRQLDALNRADPALAHYLDQSSQLAARLLKKRALGTHN